MEWRYWTRVKVVERVLSLGARAGVDDEEDPRVGLLVAGVRV